MAAVFFMFSGISAAYFLQLWQNSKVIEITEIPETVSEPVSSDSVEEQPAASNQTEAEVKETVKKDPPKYTAPIKKTETVKNDGSKTVVISDGDISASDITRLSQVTLASASPYSIPFTDQTGSYGYIESVLKDYLNSKLRWGEEIKELKEIVIRNAGSTGWVGQYSGSYTISPSGDIISAFGYITLNTYYYQDSPYFNDYMKLVLSHEYGHHYTQYYKWVEMDLASGTRFPAAYYEARPLSYENTSANCTSWSSCDSEIIAEDYSYFYSGYGLQAMSNIYGYPSSQTKTWLDGLINYQTPVIVDDPPNVSFSSPANGSTVLGRITIAADASDDNGISKVEFFIDGSLLASDTASPYQADINTASYINGEHEFKAIAWDNANQQTATVISVLLNNPVVDTAIPTVSIKKPGTDPTDWNSGNMQIEAEAADNIGVVKIEIYINDTLAASETAESIARTWKYFPGVGEYELKIKAYDEAGNIGQSSLIIQKTS